MILVKMTKVNRNQKISEKINIYEQTINFSGLKCICGNRDFDIHGSYVRNVVDVEDEYIINIKRVKCRRCHKTHALIPDFLMPYYQSVADKIVECVSKMIEENKSTVEVEKLKNVIRQKLNQWRKRYYKLKNIIRETFSRIIKIKEFYDSENRIKVYHNYNIKYLIQVTT